MQRCLWCGEADKGNYKEITMNIKFANPPQEKAMVCSAECEKRVSDTCRFIEKGILFYVVGVVIGALTSIAAIFSPLIGKNLMPVAIIGLLIFGATIIITPFVTPQTVQLLGLKKGMLSGRICGMIAIMIAIVLLLKTV
jgi:hypothetical protein